MAFALGGKGLLKEFRKQRAQGSVDQSDAFFTRAENTMSESPDMELVVNDSVVEWLQGLTDRFVEEKCWIEDLIAIILGTLKINPGERLRAFQVYEKLERLLKNHFEPQDDSTLSSATASQSKQIANNSTNSSPSPFVPTAPRHQTRKRTAAEIDGEYEEIEKEEEEIMAQHRERKKKLKEEKKGVD